MAAAKQSPTKGQLQTQLFRKVINSSIVPQFLVITVVYNHSFIYYTLVHPNPNTRSIQFI